MPSGHGKGSDVFSGQYDPGGHLSALEPTDHKNFSHDSINELSKIQTVLRNFISSFFEHIAPSNL